MLATEVPKSRRIELILRQIDALPTLPAVATRLLGLTASNESHTHEVVSLISSDPPLTAKVLTLCRAADRGVRNDVLTVDRAVVLLGFNAIRNAVLSIKVFETFAGDEPGRASDPDRPGRRGKRRDPLTDPTPPDEVTFDRTAFWRHSLAVAVAAELIARAHPQHKDLSPEEAFVCGLLHDIGKLALDHVLPKAFARVIGLAELNQGNIAEFERRIVGIDHHTAGKRLAEQWQLPHRLQDCIWLHGSAYESLPRLEHRRMIGLIGLADLIVRRQRLGYSGNFTYKQDPHQLAAALDLRPEAVDTAILQLHEEVERRSQSMGLDDRPSRELFLQSIQQANAELGRLNAALERRSRQASSQTRVLEGIGAFHAAAAPGRSVQDVLDAVVGSAAQVLGRGFWAVIYQSPEPVAEACLEVPESGGDHAAWLISQYNDHAEPLRSQWIAPPPHSPSLAGIEADPGGVSLNLMGILPWISDYLLDAEDMRGVRLLPLSSGWGTVAVLLHDRPSLPPWPQLAPLCSTWGAAIAATAQHDGARRLGEQLAEANRALAEAQDRLLQTESLARLGEMAAGAAHEMNNPLAVISGRSQLLAASLRTNSKEQKAAQTIFEQSHRLSDLITALRLFADPPKPQRRATRVGALLDDTVRRVKQAASRPDKHKPMYLHVKDPMPTIHLDPQMTSQAVSELLRNAIEASPRESIHLTAQIDADRQQLMIQVTDDGVGMDDYVLSHAMDPFFSAKPAGRQMGMGLARARQLALSQGGDLTLRSTPDVGTVATLWLPLNGTEAA